MGASARPVRRRSANLVGFGAEVALTPESSNVFLLLPPDVAPLLWSRSHASAVSGRTPRSVLLSDALPCLRGPPVSNLRSATVGSPAPRARPSKPPVVLAPRSSNSRMSCPPCRGGIARGTFLRLRPQRCHRRRRNPAPMRLPPRTPVAEAASLYYPPCR